MPVEATAQTMAGMLLFYAVLVLLWPLAIPIVLACCLYNLQAVMAKLQLFASCAAFFVRRGAGVHPKGNSEADREIRHELLKRWLGGCRR